MHTMWSLFSHPGAITWQSPISKSELSGASLETPKDPPHGRHQWGQGGGGGGRDQGRGPRLLPPLQDRHQQRLRPCHPPRFRARGWETVAVQVVWKELCAPSGAGQSQESPLGGKTFSVWCLWSKVRDFQFSSRCRYSCIFTILQFSGSIKSRTYTLTFGTSTWANAGIPAANAAPSFGENGSLTVTLTRSTRGKNLTLVAFARQPLSIRNMWRSTNKLTGDTMKWKVTTLRFQCREVALPWLQQDLQEQNQFRKSQECPQTI